MSTKVTNSMISFDGGSLGFRNKIINGKMTVASNGTSFNVDQNTQYTLNQWEVTSALGSGKGTVTQVTDVPTNGEFQNSLRFATTVVQNANTQHIGIAQYIKGYNVRDLVESSFTISFWVKSNKTGIYTLSFRNEGTGGVPDRVYVTNYTINIANRWEKKTITIARKIDTTGTWNWFSGTGLKVLFTLAGASTFTNLNTWVNTNEITSSGQVNLLDVGGNNFNITGVQLEKGVVATPFEHRHRTIEVNLATEDESSFDGGSFTFRNKIINGNFDIWQRGTSLSSGAGARYLADRWSNYSVGSTYTTQRLAFDLGQGVVSGEPTYYHRTIVTSIPGANNYVSLGQHIESVRTLVGKTVTCSFWARTTGTNKYITARLNQNFGTGGTPSSRVYINPGYNFLLTTSFQKFTFTASIPSISGKTLGTNGDDCLTFGFIFDAGSNLNEVSNSLGQQSGTFDIAQVQVEEGSVATPFEHRPIGTELALCQRYYEKSYDVNVVPGTATNNGLVLSSIVAVVRPGSNGIGSVKFGTTKRSYPTIKIYSNITGVINKFANYAESGSPDRDASAQTVADSGFYTQYDGVTSLTNPLAVYQWTAESEL